jgi:hypothetical protein
MDPNLSVALFCFAFVGLWIGVSFFTARGNWAALAGAYRYRGTFPSSRWHRQDGNVGSEGFENGLTVGADSEGLYLAIVFLFRAGHPPLFIPWTDVSVRTEERFLATFMVFHFRSVPSVPLRVGESLGQRLAVAAGRSWPGLPQDRGGLLASRD